MTQRICPSCSIHIEDSWSICVVCGAPLPTGSVRSTTESAPPTERHTQALVSVIEKDGSVSRDFEFLGSDGPRKTIGKSQADISFPDEPFLNNEHAALEWKNGRLWLCDLESQNGVFVRIRSTIKLRHKDSFLAGDQYFTYEHADQGTPESSDAEDSVKFNGTPIPAWNYRIQQIFTGGIVGAAWPVFSDKFTIGREGGDASFEKDGFMSRSHCEIHQRGEHAELRDQNSRNGTYIRIQKNHRVQNGDYLRLGERLLRVTYRA